MVGFSLRETNVVIRAGPEFQLQPESQRFLPAQIVGLKHAVIQIFRHEPGFLAMSHFDSPIRLIKNQNTSIKNADALNLKMRESMISNEPAALSSENLKDELGSLSSCSSR